MLTQVLDEWIEQTIQPYCKGKVKLFRYADDAIICVEKKQMQYASGNTSQKAREIQTSTQRREDQNGRILKGKSTEWNTSRNV